MKKFINKAIDYLEEIETSSVWQGLLKTWKQPWFWVFYLFLIGCAYFLSKMF